MHRVSAAGIILLFGLGTVALCADLTVKPAPQAPLGKGERVTNPRALIVRGMNVTFCDATSIGAGSDPKVGVNTDVQNLSVNCSPDGKTNVNTLAKNLPNPHSCWATLEQLEARNSSIIVTTDTLPNNQYHCLVRDITPNEMVKALHYKP